MRCFGSIIAFVLGLFSSIVCFAASTPPASQWDFNDSLDPSLGGLPLVLSYAKPATGAQLSFTNSTIAGQEARVARFQRGTFFRAVHRLAANGGGILVNQYTVIMDVRFDERLKDFTALFQTSSANANDAEWFMDANGGLGISGVYGGNTSTGEWHRLALVVDGLQGKLSSFIDGTRVQELSSGVLVDGRFALFSSVLIFADNDEENATGLINSLQIRSEALSAAELAELGSPSADGIPLPLPTKIRLLAPRDGDRWEAGTPHIIEWTSENPVGNVRIDLWDGDSRKAELGTASLRAGQFEWIPDISIGDGTNYTVQLASLVDTNIVNAPQGRFAIFGSLPLNPLYGQPLQRNGGFEEGWTNWVIQAGTPAVLTQSDAKGQPHSGLRFFHGGKRAPAPEAVVRQTMDLLAAGFASRELDARAALSAEAWVRNPLQPEQFDDQVFVRVTYLDENGASLSSLRCIIPANPIWSRKLLSGLLPIGTRKLGMEVVGKHRRDLDNDAMADDLVLRVVRPALNKEVRITKLPMLQDYRQDAMTLIWETDGNLCSHQVEWGIAQAEEHVVSDIETLQIDDTHFVHRAEITGLKAETQYQYRVRSGKALAGAYSFNTAPQRTTGFAVAWWGDNHNGTSTLRTHVSNIVQHAPNLICVAGDMVNSGNSISEWHDYWFKPLEYLNASQTIPVLYARGNHDGEHALAYAYSALPGNGAWFSFPYGNSWFIFLDSEAPSSEVPEQLVWLKAELQRPEVRAAAFRIVCFHKPPWTDFWNGGGYTGEQWVRDIWTPVLAQNNVDVVVSGHTHAYCRGSTNGVMYVVSGGGGGTVDTERVARWPMFQAEYTDTHFDLMEVDGCNLDWRAFNAKNELIDQFRLRCRGPELSWVESPPGENSLALALAGRPGLTYILDRSDDLRTWVPWSTNMIPIEGPSETVHQVVPQGGQGFYRARVK
jgi:Calcineurin-like phosphoesterase/Purple acid Phosphatase, N-terminal domain/Concanavalin A-like lectin/glucanases superfamily